MSINPTQHPPVPMWTIGDRLAKAREFADLTQEQMAKRLQIGRRSIVRYETSGSPPRSIVISYSAITGVPLWWFDGPEGDGTGVDTTWYTCIDSELVAA